MIGVEEVVDFVGCLPEDVDGEYLSQEVLVKT